MKFQRIVATGLALVFALVASSGLAVAAGKPAPSGKVNINTATAQQLTVLPGVGEKLAARIVDYRQKSGASRSVGKGLYMSTRPSERREEHHTNRPASAIAYIKVRVGVSL